MSRHVCVIGAGAVGAATALELLRDGHRVSIFEPGEPGGEQAASYGAGGWLSPASVIPPGGPGTWRRVPRMVTDRLAPLAIRWEYFMKATPWLAHFLSSGWTEARVARTAQALRPLLRDAPALHRALAEEAGVGHLIEQKGVLLIYPDRAAFEAEAMAFRIRRSLGIRWVELDGEALWEREPALDQRYRFGVLFEEAGHCTDPGPYVAALVALAERRGARMGQFRAIGLRIVNRQFQGVVAEEGMLVCDAAVICAGARSRALAETAANRVPLESERGYHVVLRDPEVRPGLPLMPSDANMAITMTAGGLRCAGQGEIAGLEAEPNWKRAEVLRDHLLRCFPGLPPSLPGKRFRIWTGHRPSMPDGLPCIGRSRASANVIYAFGHGHIGLAAAARTGRVVAQIIGGRTPEIPIEPFAALRFY